MMNENTIPIPDWNNDGVLPPFLGEFDSPYGILPSPYPAQIVELVSRFGNSEERRELLLGLLDFRSELHKAGLTRGFQWVDGSFVEDVENENLRNCPPGDIDIVTFFYIPDGHTEESLVEAFPDLFDRCAMRARFGMDAFPVLLDQTDPETLVERSAYWYGVWSHRRDDLLWKGFIQIDLADSEDECARAEINKLISEEGGKP